jgi:hypothetical protein
MDDLVLNLVVLAVFAIAAVTLFGVARRRQALREQALRQAAAQRGWNYQPVREPLAWGLRISSPRWAIESLSRSAGVESGPGSSNIQESTRWQADCPGRAVLVGPRLPGSTLQGPGLALAQFMIVQAIGPEANGLHEVEAGSSTLRQRYSLWAQEPQDAQALISPAVESALLGWKGKEPVIKRTQAGLSIEINGSRITKVEEIEALVQLGEALLSASANPIH